MSGSIDVLQLDKKDVVKFLASGTHLGSTNINHQMSPYVYKRKPDGKILPHPHLVLKVDLTSI